LLNLGGGTCRNYFCLLKLSRQLKPTEPFPPLAQRRFQQRTTVKPKEIKDDKCHWNVRRSDLE
jgi:hypothetical protein